jgi:hypothetical protein
MIDPKTFIDATEAALLKDVGERFKSYFNNYLDEYVGWDECQKEAGGLKTLWQDHESHMPEPRFEKLPENLQSLLYFKRQAKNPRSVITPMGQVNMIANVTFHLMAQQLALLFTQAPDMSREKVYQTAFENVRKLTLTYLNMIREDSNHG